MSNEICLFFWHEAPGFVFSLHWLCKDKLEISTFLEGVAEVAFGAARAHT